MCKTAKILYVPLQELIILAGVFSFLILAIPVHSLTVAEQRPLMGFPDIHENRVVYREDSWTVSAQGGVAVCLTIHDGEERFPQLMKALEVLMQKIKQDPRPWPQHEPFPLDK
jgi:hypothetical protein